MHAQSIIFYQHLYKGLKSIFTKLEGIYKKKTVVGEGQSVGELGGILKRIIEYYYYKKYIDDQSNGHWSDQLSFGAMIFQLKNDYKLRNQMVVMSLFGYN